MWHPSRTFCCGGEIKSGGARLALLHVRMNDVT
jgi:hypothetical protein